MESEEVSSKLVAAIEAVENLLITAQNQSENVYDFVENKLGGSLGPAIGIYARLFKSLDCRNRDDLENILKKNYKHSQIQDAFEQLLELETRWNSFLSRVDANLQGTDDRRKVFGEGDMLTQSIELVNARSNSKVSVQSLLLDKQPTQYVHLVLLRHFA